MKPEVVISYNDAIYRFTTLVNAPARIIKPLLGILAIPHQYDSERRAYKVPKNRADDLLAALELDGYRVVSELGW